MRTPKPRAPRGAATTEFALVAPLLVTMLFFSMFFVELVHAKLKIQEASRFLAWEYTSFPLTDYGGTAADRNKKAFDQATTQSLQSAMDRFQDLDSVDEKATKGNFVVAFKDVKIAVQNLEVNPVDNPINNKPNAAGAGALANKAISAFGGGLNWVYGRFGFNTKGKIQIDTTMTLDNLILPRHFLDTGGSAFFSVDGWGGRNLQNFALKNRFTVIADGWTLPDGADSVANKGVPRAGMHDGGATASGLYTQVNRMKNLGLNETLDSIPGFKQVMSMLGKVIPNPFNSAFAVSHNYGVKGRDNKNCDIQDSHPAKEGLNDLEKSSSLDHHRLNCYDTIPFRDQASYAKSSGIQMYNQRGDYFMGCENAQADDPSENGPPTSSKGDKNSKKVKCMNK